MKSEIKFYLIRHMLKCLKSAGFNWREKRDKIKEVISGQLQTVNDILIDGLDIGTIIEYRIPVQLIHHPEYGWCFDGGKKHGLYRVIDHLK